MKLKRSLCLLAVLILISAVAVAAGPTKQERQHAQNMINNGNALRSRFEQEREEFIKAGNKWLKNPTEENKQAALKEMDEMDAAEARLKANRDSTIAYVDSVFGIDKPAGTDVQYDPECTDYGYTSERCFVRLCEPAFESPDILASTKIHEYEHVKQKKAGRWGPGNTPQACTFRFHELEFDAYEAEMDADFGGKTSLPLDEKLEILRRKLEHLRGMLRDLAAQFEGDKVHRSLRGKTLEKAVTIANDADYSQYVYGHFEDQYGWVISPPAFEMFLEGEQETTFTILVEIPPTSELGIGNEIMCYAYSGMGDLKERMAILQADSAKALFYVNVIPSVDVVPGEDVAGFAGDDVDFYFTIVNEGDFPDSFNVYLTSSLGWALSPTSWTISLGPGESIDIISTVSIPPEPGFTTDVIYCTATSLTDVAQTDSSWLSAMVDVAAGIDIDGRFDFELMQNTPNPFRGSTIIRFSLPTAAQVDLRIFDVRGRLVRTLLSGQSGMMAPSIHSKLWDGLDNNGQPVASGVYYYRLQSGKEVATRKLVILR